MSRQLLENRVGKRDMYTGIFVKKSARPDKKGFLQTLLLEDLRDSQGECICSHMWFTMTKGFLLAQMVHGDKIQFVGKVEEYERNHFSQNPSVPNGSIDYRLTGLTHIVNLSKIGQACSCSL